MSNLFRFIWQYYIHFLFVILEAISLIFLVQNNYYHNSGFINSTNIISGNYYTFTSSISDYFGLKNENNRLAEENAKLHSESFKSFLIPDTNIFICIDTLKVKRFEYTRANVIKNSVNRKNNYLTLNKGIRFGIEKEMGVISPKGVLGIIKNTSNNFSSVISVLHSKSKISARLKRTKYVGTVEWHSNNYRYGELLYIPSHVELIKGDTIITSGYSSIFPAGILVGTVFDYKKDEHSNFYDITLCFFEDYNNIDQVYIIRNILFEEQNSIEMEESDE